MRHSRVGTVVAAAAAGALLPAAMPVLAAVNKIDLMADKSALLPRMAEIAAMRAFVAIVPISADERQALAWRVVVDDDLDLAPRIIGGRPRSSGDSMPQVPGFIGRFKRDPPTGIDGKGIGRVE